MYDYHYEVPSIFCSTVLSAILAQMSPTAFRHQPNLSSLQLDKERHPSCLSYFINLNYLTYVDQNGHFLAVFGRDSATPITSQALLGQSFGLHTVHFTQLACCKEVLRRFLRRHLAAA
ncbi:hypothetical protein HBH70_040700 [Parastagonospora nodorum]|nr:hypothetical protein HBI09_025340 [Parastagonospora nodorum]KAH4272670.1 hypothetical protein HBI03_027010 [Parastagonospora nodorum]KAH4277262.1 hypothetical protein HBI04_105840 [Parastagonospora nodorum]KAH4998091.1 hypothetical protein HBI77_192870 [Parastagonospora nodorum]KAH5147337.1 hypothetical protein HBH70_040700 [Parastagonospora nodorum]